MLFLSYSLSILLSSILNGLSNFNWLGLTNFCLSLICIPILFYLTTFYKINGALIGLIVIYFLQSFSFLIKLFNSKFSFIFSLKVLLNLKNLLNSSKYIFLHEVVYSVSNVVFLIILVKTLNFSDLGLYNAGDHLTQMILFIPTSILGYFLNQYILKDENDAKEFKIYFLKYSILFSVVLASFIFLLKDIIIGFLEFNFIN